jgi:hypothetical protein
MARIHSATVAKVRLWSTVAGCGLRSCGREAEVFSYRAVLPAQVFRSHLDLNARFFMRSTPLKMVYDGSGTELAIQQGLWKADGVLTEFGSAKK